jgi:hypothetical protein
VQAPVARHVVAADVEALADFACSRGAWYEDEVEEFIQERALSWALAPGPRARYRRLLLFESEGLVAVGGFGPRVFEDALGDIVDGTELQVLALEHEARGTILEDGRRLSDACMATLVQEASRERGTNAMSGIAAKDHTRSIELCSDHGLTKRQPVGDSRYIRMVGRAKSA